MQAIFMAEVTSEQTGDIVNFVSSDIRKIYDGLQVCLSLLLVDPHLHDHSEGSAHVATCCMSSLMYVQPPCHTARSVHTTRDYVLLLQEFHFLWAAPWEALTILILVSTDVGKWMLPAFGLVFFVIFIQYFFGWRIAVNKYRCAEYIAQR